MTSEIDCNHSNASGACVTVLRVRKRSWPVERFTALLERVLREAGLTQRDLAALIPIDSSQITRWKRGDARPGFDALRTLGEAIRADYPDLDVGPGDFLAAAGYDAPAVRVYGAAASTEPVTNAEHVDDELARWINDALRAGVDVSEWDLTDKIERELFSHPSFNWNEKSGMRMSYLAYRAQARERQRRESGEASAANGTPQ